MLARALLRPAARFPHAAVGLLSQQGFHSSYCDSRSECNGWLGKFCADSDKLGPKGVGMEWSPKARADGCRASPALLLRHCAVPSMLRQWLCETTEAAFPFTEIFIWGCFSEQNLLVLLCYTIRSVRKVFKYAISPAGWAAACIVG